MIDVCGVFFFPEIPGFRKTTRNKQKVHQTADIQHDDRHCGLARGDFAKPTSDLHRKKTQLIRVFSIEMPIEFASSQASSLTLATSKPNFLATAGR